MLDDYLIVHKSILPPYFETVLEAREMFESGKVENISQAVKEKGISRSTYYKYKNFIYRASYNSEGRKAVISMMLSHETGTLSNVLSYVSETGASILTMTQSLPINGKANVTITIDTSSMSVDPIYLIQQISSKKGVESPKLLAVE